MAWRENAPHRAFSNHCTSANHCTTVLSVKIICAYKFLIWAIGLVKKASIKMVQNISSNSYAFYKRSFFYYSIYRYLKY